MGGNEGPDPARIVVGSALLFQTRRGQVAVNFADVPAQKRGKQTKCVISHFRAKLVVGVLFTVAAGNGSRLLTGRGPKRMLFPFRQERNISGFGDGSASRPT